MGRVRSGKVRTGTSSHNSKRIKKRRREALTETSSATPGDCPNLVLVGFQDRLHFQTIYKLFQRHGIKDHGEMTRRMQEQWGSCSRYTNKLNKYWWNLQSEQKKHFAMLRKEARKNRKTEKKIETSHVATASEDDIHGEKNCSRASW
ncbi:hypothetical protein Dda_6155 [Drechslerella dactyloides]|uniref:Uncharacterized protein n=1 Tax=Drechslerella dactyloides TaxID=74499 RepID=A0AAD6NGZ9_DREDA|nr:hypothetical protein Dda_6155 [Drechslerella dactyloides]